jgi:membrane-associated phospholipid phosphatase
MSAVPPTTPPSCYFAQLTSFIGLSLAHLVRTPSHSRRAEAGRHWARRSLWLVTITAVVIVVLMYLLDAVEIGLMPPRGTSALWPVRILTDFGKSNYILWMLAALLLVFALLLPRLRGQGRAVLIACETRIAFVFLAVLLPVLAGEVIKGIVGRGRPFVGGAANPFNFSYFAWSESFASFPSGHAIASAALAFAVAALWPRLRVAMLLYVIVICLSRLLLLAHHPSDVVAGALVGVVGAMFVRYWFATRHLAFTIHRDGGIAALAGPSPGHLKRVARDAFAP